MKTHKGSDGSDERTVRSFTDRLDERAEGMVKQGTSAMNAVEAQEPILDQWEHGDLQVTKRPDDEQGILRISVGGGSDLIKGIDYCVFRGDRTRCAFLLEQAAKAMRER